MPILIHDYLIDTTSVDWPKALKTWTWLIPNDFTLWFANRFADLFVVMSDNSIHMLDVGAGTFTKIANSREEFSILIDEDDNANEWLMIPLVNELVQLDILLQPGQCYGFKYPPVLGGQHSVENVGVLPVWDYLGTQGSIHEQLRDVPDGTPVKLKVITNKTDF